MNTDFLLSYPKCLILTDDYLIIQDSHAHDFYYHIIKKDSGILVKEFGMKGQGPKDFIQATINPLYNYKKNEIQIFDQEKRCLCYYDINNNDIFSQNINNAAAKYQFYLTNFFDMDSCYLATGMNGYLNTSRFVVFDKSLKLIGKQEYYPVLDCDDDINRELNSQVFNIFFLKISPNKKNMVFASYRIGLMEIFSMNELPEKLTGLNLYS
jgi:hypothetical protein